MAEPDPVLMTADPGDFVGVRVKCPQHDCEWEGWATAVVVNIYGVNDVQPRRSKCIHGLLVDVAKIIEVIKGRSTPNPRERKTMEHKPMPNPTPEAVEQNPLFAAIWNVIKSWDVNVPDYYDGYCGANGSHVELILGDEKVKEVLREVIYQAAGAGGAPMFRDAGNLSGGEGYVFPEAEVLAAVKSSLESFGLGALVYPVPA